MVLEIDATDIALITARIKSQAASEKFRVALHAQQEMTAENFTLTEVLEAISNGTILENYPEHRRGACCLLCGETGLLRPAHIVCATSLPKLIIVTVYEPKPPKWITPTQRRQL